MSTNALNIVVLAAGKGTRMHSKWPKVLQPLAGQALLQHVIDRAKALQPSKIIVVYGYAGDAVRQAFAHENIVWVEQAQQLGTGHAMQQAAPYLEANAKCLILLGDVPLVDVDTCRKLIDNTQQLGLLTVHKQDATGYGRIVRNAQGQVQAIVEHKDATSEQRRINEVNTGIMVADNAYLLDSLGKLNNHNAQAEYYLTDIVAMAQNVSAVTTQDEASVAGINNKQDLAVLERIYQSRQAEQLLLQGVTLLDPQRIDIRGHLSVGQDVEIDVGCVFIGQVSLADGVKIGPYCVIKDSQIGSNSKIAAFTHIDQANMAQDCIIGPYARLRPGTQLANQTHIGNFVELKNAQVDTGSKINHLSYIGDASVGKQVNIGAGTITCNYDGVNKFQTIIEDDVFIGSDSQLIAPVTIGKGSTIGAGSTITKDTPAHELSLSRAKQLTITGWKRPVKIKK